MAWQPRTTGVRGWGRVRVVFDGRDVTYFRLAPVQVQSMQFADPFGPASAVIVFPQITVYDVPGSGSVSWLHAFAPVEIDRVYYIEDPDNLGQDPPVYIRVIERMFDGVAAQFKYEDMGVQVVVMGALYEADFMVRGPRHLKREIPREEWIMFALSPLAQVRRHLDYKPLIIEGGPTGFVTRHSGNWERPLTGYVADSLAQMVNLDGTRWTLQIDDSEAAVGGASPGAPQPVLRIRDVTTVHWRAHAGAVGVHVNLDYDPSTIATRIHGAGVDQAGTEWRRMQYLPRDPLTETSPVWLAASAKTEAERYHDPTNTMLGPGPGYDPTVTAVEQFYRFPYGVSLLEARTYAQQQIDATAHKQVLTGTITLRADVQRVASSWMRGRSRFNVRAGENIALVGFQGRTALMHIAGVSINFDSLEVTLTVDEAARDLLTVEDLLERQKEVAESPSGRLRLGDQSAISEDTRVVWNYEAGSGYIPYESRPQADPGARIACSGGSWTVVPILMSTKGSAGRIRLASSPPVAFHASMYREPVDPGDLPANPLAPDAFVRWDHPARELSVVGWGEVTTVFGPQRAGYWPGMETRPDGLVDPLTGVLQDDGEWNWDLDAEKATLWLAIYPAAGASFAGRIYHGVQ